jgi:hypothetical protein
MTTVWLGAIAVEKDVNGTSLIVEPPPPPPPPQAVSAVNTIGNAVLLMDSIMGNSSSGGATLLEASPAEKALRALPKRGGFFAKEVD